MKLLLAGALVLPFTQQPRPLPAPRLYQCNTLYDLSLCYDQRGRGNFIQNWRIPEDGYEPPPRQWRYYESDED